MMDDPEIDDIALPDVSSIGLPPSRDEAGAKPGFRRGEVGAQINEGILLVFDASLSPQNIEDISNSVLLAQLAADHDASRFAPLSDWWKSFTDTLSKVGWTVSGSNFAGTTRGPPVDWQEAVQSLLSGTAAGLGRVGIDAGQALLPESPALQVWSRGAIGVDGGMLVVGVCQASGGSPTLTLAAVGFTLNTWVGTFFEGKLTYDLRSAEMAAELNEGIYARVRAAIIRKLGNYPESLVIDVPVGGQR